MAGHGGRRYAVALIAVAIAGMLRLMMRPIIETEAPFLLFFAAVMASGWYGGFRPAIFATFMSAIVVSAFFMEQMNPPGLLEADTWRLLRLAIFLFEGTITSALCGQLHSARMRAEKSAAEARELERTVEEISEAEQRRIGQDLHDGLGQHLTGVAFLSKALQQKLHLDRRPEAAEAATINDLVNESIRWTRDLARGLAPMDLDRTCLPESLRELARKTSRMFNVECAYEGVEQVEVADDAVALNLYRVAQEAVSNGVKHGKARHVTIDLEVDQDLVLSIQDDGVGFEYLPGKQHVRRDSAGTAISGMGLLVMRYRAGVIGGKLEIESSPDKGTIVRCRLAGSETAVRGVGSLVGPTTSGQGRFASSGGPLRMQRPSALEENTA
ncbi:ATP-binding protein [Humisphaera borealis]|uniref:Sensor histidine kinase n=1 Tax=Humisphaera borealis TaxID=2807512 RepID=A0A7M2WU08_9BACT|nr:sensor histidine kinase [Humisphaera borealis]QOV88754.1 sensor histidine kinase [Humisphaera borealis]